MSLPLGGPTPCWPALRDPGGKSRIALERDEPGSNRRRLLSKACLSWLTGLQKGHNSADAQEIATARKIEDNW